MFRDLVARAKKVAGSLEITNPSLPAEGNFDVAT